MNSLNQLNNLNSEKKSKKISVKFIINLNNPIIQKIILDLILFQIHKIHKLINMHKHMDFYFQILKMLMFKERKNQLTKDQVNNV